MFICHCYCSVPTPAARYIINPSAIAPAATWHPGLRDGGFRFDSGHAGAIVGALVDVLVPFGLVRLGSVTAPPNAFFPRGLVQVSGTVAGKISLLRRRRFAPSGGGGGDALDRRCGGIWTAGLD